MYGIRSSIVHQGEYKKRIKYKDIVKLTHYLSLCIKLYIILNKNFGNKKKLINFFEEGIFGNEISLPDLDDYKSTH